MTTVSNLPPGIQKVYQAAKPESVKELHIRGDQFTLLFSDGSSLGFHPPLDTDLGPTPWKIVLEQKGLAWNVFRPFASQFNGTVLMSGGHAGQHTYGYSMKQGASKGEYTMSSLRQAIQRVAAKHPETRAHLVPLLRKYAEDVTAATQTYEEYVRDYKALQKKYPKAVPQEPLSQEKWEKAMGVGKTACTCPDGGKSAADGDELMGGRTWGLPDPHSKPDDKKPYHKWKNSPDAGPDGSTQRGKYNDWYRLNVCPKHKTTCGAPWLKDGPAGAEEGKKEKKKKE